MSHDPQQPAPPKAGVCTDACVKYGCDHFKVAPYCTPPRKRDAGGNLPEYDKDAAQPAVPSPAPAESSIMGLSGCIDFGGRVKFDEDGEQYVEPIENQPVAAVPPVAQPTPPHVSIPQRLFKKLYDFLNRRMERDRWANEQHELLTALADCAEPTRERAMDYCAMCHGTGKTFDSHDNYTGPCRCVKPANQHGDSVVYVAEPSASPTGQDAEYRDESEFVKTEDNIETWLKDYGLDIALLSPTGHEQEARELLALAVFHDYGDMKRVCDFLRARDQKRDAVLKELTEKVGKFLEVSTTENEQALRTAYERAKKLTK